MAQNTPGGEAARSAIIDLMNRYAHALDTRDWGLLESCFTKDATFHARKVLDNAVPDADFMVIEGRDAFIAGLRAIWQGLSATHHMLSNHVVTLAGDGHSAQGSCYMRAHHVGNRERAHLFEESLGRFDFDLVRAGQEWKIRRMDENIFIILGTEEAFENPVQASG